MGKKEDLKQQDFAEKMQLDEFIEWDSTCLQVTPRINQKHFRNRFLF